MFIREFFMQLHSEFSENKDSEYDEYTNLGIQKFNLKLYEAAIAYFTKAIHATKDPKKQARAYCNLGNVQHVANQSTLAIASFEAGLILDPDNFDLNHDLGAMYLHYNKDPVKALYHLNKTGPQEDSVLLTHRGIAKQRMNDEGAKEDFQKACALNPKDKLACANLAQFTMLRSEVKSSPVTLRQRHSIKSS